MDGRDWCPVHRAQYARTIAPLIPAEEWLPTGPLPPSPRSAPDWGAMFDAAASSPKNTPGGGLIPLEPIPAGDITIAAGWGLGEIVDLDLDGRG